MKKITSMLFSFLITFSIASTLVIASPAPASAAGNSCSERLLTFPTWYNGLLDGDCEIDHPGQGDTDISTFIWKIVLNIIDMIMQLVGYASVIFLIIGGFRYMTSTGDPAKMTAAKSTIMNAIIGLVIALASVAIVNTIAGVI